MNYWQKILRASTVGLNRVPVNPDEEWPEWAHKLYASTDQPTTAILRIAATRSVIRKAGYEPAPVSANSRTILAPEEALEPASDSAALFLNQVLELENKTLLKEYLDLLAEEEKLLPPGNLPAVFRFIIDHKGPLKSTTRVMGERGQWLAELNKAWKLFLPPTEKDWETGKIEDRVRYLHELRKTDLPKARNLFEALYSKEPPMNLVRLMAALRTGAGPEDEAVLESLLGHRRGEVRLKAAELLANIPKSNFVLRMQGRLTALVNYRKKLLKETFEVGIPAEMNPEMQRDGVLDNPFQGIGLGTKSSWLTYIIAVVPPAWWTNQFGLKPEKLLSLNRKAEWKKAMMLGWIAATINHEEEIWATAILPELLKDKELYEFIPASYTNKLLELISVEKRDELIEEELRKQRIFDEHNVALRFITDNNIRPQLKLARVFLGILMEALSKGRSNPGFFLRNKGYQLRDISLRMPIELYPEVEHAWQEPHDEITWYRKHTNAFIDMLGFRRDMINAIRS